MEETNVSLKAVTETLQKELPAIVGEVVNAKMADLETKTLGQIEEVKAELKNMTLSKKEVTQEVKEFQAKTAVVAGFKEVAKGGNFESAVSASYKAMSEGVATDGAELVFDQFERDVIRVINTYDVLAMTRTFSILKGDKITFPRKDGSTTAYIVGENTAITESEVSTGALPIDIYKIATLTEVTNELLDDTMTIPDLYQLIVEDVAEQVAALREDLVLGGTGTAQPRGITQTAGIQLVQLAATQRVSNINDSTLVEVMTKAPKKYKRGNMVWIMSQYTMGKLMALKTTDGYPLYPELRNFGNPSLLGKKVVISDSTKITQAEGAANDVSIIYGDIQYFYSVERKGLTFEKGHLSNSFRDDKTAFRSVNRFGGAVSIPAAFTVLRNGLT
jgi:HK97 family phage major capsid protein